MPKDPKPKKKVGQKLSQKEKFIAYAKEIGADETGERFERALGVMLKKDSHNDSGKDT